MPSLLVTRPSISLTKTDLTQCHLSCIAVNTLVVRQHVCGYLHLLSVCLQSVHKTVIASSRKPRRLPTCVNFVIDSHLLLIHGTA